MIAGTLEVQMLANLARLSKDMSDAKRTVTSTMQGIERSAGTAMRALGALGLGIGLLGFGRMVKGAIDAQDELSKLSQKLNISVENLVGYQHAADLSGVSSESFTKGMKSLGSQLFDASMGLLESQRNFKALGIEIKGADGRLKDSDKVLIEVADRFAKLKDGTEKSALAVKLFGKAGLDMIPMLNMGSAALAEMVKEGQELNPTTAESARQAEIFNDNMSRLTKTITGAGIAILNDFLPHIAKMSEAMVQAKKDGDGFFGTLIKGWRQLVTGDDQHKFNVQTVKAFDDLTAAEKQVSTFTRLLAEMPENEKAKQMLATAQVRLWNAQQTVAKLKEIEHILLAPPAPAAKAGTGGAAGGLDDAALRAAAKAQLQQDEQFARKFADSQAVEDAYMAANIDFTSDWQEKRLEAIMEAGAKERKVAQDAAQYEVDLAKWKAEQLALEDAEAYRAKMQFLGNLSGLMNTNSRKLFEVGKMASIATAVIKGQESAVSAYAAGSKIGGPWLGAAFAAASILATGNMIANIKAQTFGGGGGGGGSSGGGVPIAPTQGSSGIAPQQERERERSPITVNVHGNLVGNQAFVDDVMIPAIRDAVDNRDFVLIGPNSRQAANLA